MVLTIKEYKDTYEALLANLLPMDCLTIHADGTSRKVSNSFMSLLNTLTSMKNNYVKWSASVIDTDIIKKEQCPIFKGNIQDLLNLMKEVKNERTFECVTGIEAGKAFITLIDSHQKQLIKAEGRNNSAQASNSWSNKFFSRFKKANKDEKAHEEKVASPSVAM